MIYFLHLLVDRYRSFLFYHQKKKINARSVASRTSPAGIIISAARNCEGLMAVETAIVATVVALLSLGAFQVSSFVARQNELQGAAADALAIALASHPTTTDQLATIKSILQTSTGLSSDKVAVSYVYKCGTDNVVLTSASSCSNTDANRLYTYIHVVMTDTYNPIWSAYGVGSGVNLSVDRTVEIS